MAENRLALVAVSTLLVLVVLVSGAVIFVMHWRAVSNQSDRWYLYRVSDLLHAEIHSLDSYLFSGNPDESQRLIDSHKALQTEIGRRRNRKVTPMDEKESAKLGKDEQDWYGQVAAPMIDNRKQLDAGKIKLSDLQIAYLQKDPTNFLLSLENDIRNLRLTIETSQ